jgi:hypothetical protein
MFEAFSLKFKDLRTSQNNVFVILIFQWQGYFTETGSYEHFSYVKEYAVQPFNLHQDWERYPKEFREFQRKMDEIN